MTGRQSAGTTTATDEIGIVSPPKNLSKVGSKATLPMGLKPAK
jgi:hypothetical protein